jgi:hypothetical protein
MAPGSALAALAALALAAPAAAQFGRKDERVRTAWEVELEEEEEEDAPSGWSTKPGSGAPRASPSWVSTPRRWTATTEAAEPPTSGPA